MIELEGCELVEPSRCDKERGNWGGVPESFVNAERGVRNAEFVGNGVFERGLRGSGG